MPRRAKPPDPRRLDDPRGAAQALRGLLARRVGEVLAQGGLERDQAEELVKIGTLLEKLEQGGYDLRSAAVEVGEQLAAFVAGRETDPGRLAWLADQLDAFYFSLGQGA